jgi:filamentous hemagglutinin family protein
MENFMKFQWLLLLFFTSLTLQAEITTDGSLGPLMNLPGPDYQITADLGQQHGGNLFHSFQAFNLQRFETATFSGADNVQNVISRVTGGHLSHIDGVIRSTLPNADFYFLNPDGIIFGPNARLDVLGSFHASTADYLNFADGGRFDAREPANSLLTVAPIEAYGFLTDTPAPITVEEARLRLFGGDRTFSFIGGDLTINANWSTGLDENKELDIFDPFLFVESGRINLISYASPGEVTITDVGFSLSPNSHGGQIVLNHANIGVGGFSGGNIFIRAGLLKLTNSFITNVMLGEGEGGLIDIAVDKLDLIGEQQLAGIYTDTLNTGTGSDIDIFTHQLNIAEKAAILTVTRDRGASGDIHIKATDWLNIAGQYIPTIEATNGIVTISAEEATGNTGNIKIETGQLSINQGLIAAIAEKSGHVGNIDIKVADTMNVIGAFVPEIDAPTGVFNATTGDGNAGDIYLTARQLNLDQGGQILNRTLGAGHGGLIEVNVTESIIATGMDNDGNSSGFTGQAGEPGINNTGDAANIRLQAHQLTLLAGAQIESGTSGTGKGGTISIQVADTITIAGQHQTNGENSYISASSLSAEDHAGDAGHLAITTNQLQLIDGGAIYDVTLGPGNGGTILINVGETLMITGGFERPLQRDFERFSILPSGIFATSGDIAANSGDAGQIEIHAKQILLTNGGEINNDTYGGGKGGSIKVFVTDTLKAEGKHTKFVKVEGEDGDNYFAYPSGIRSSSADHSDTAGKAGDLFIEANQIILTQEAEFSSEAVNAEGGNITIITPNSSLLQQQAKITTSVQGGTGDGGNITLTHPTVIVLDKSQIKAQADQGHGGNIRIAAEHFIQSSDSLVSASSRLGVDGKVEIDSPDQNVTPGIQTLATETLDARTQLQKTCDSMTYEDYQNRGHFEVHPLAGHPTSPYDLQPSRLAPLAAASQKIGQNRVKPHAQQIASFTVCQPATESPATPAVVENQVIPVQLF